MNNGESDNKDPDPGRTIGPQDQNMDRTIGPGSSSQSSAAGNDPGVTVGPANRANVTVGATVSGVSSDETRNRLPAKERNIKVEGYEILDELGRGGMGVVYKARDVALNRTVALKMILAGVHASDESIARFKIEAEAVAQLTHRGIVQVYDVGQSEGQPYCALEFIDGGGLDDLMQNQQLTISESVAIVEELAHAMSSAHQSGIVHRDLKPANVLISTGNTSGTSISIESLGKYRPKITDFGLAKKVEQESQQTQTGAIMGTPSYMAPEQAKGTKRIGPAADIYSLGAILYHLVSGCPPFVAETPFKTIMKVIEEVPVPPRTLNSNVDRDIDTIILKCLEKEPGSRYASAEHLAQDLNRYQMGLPIEARPVSGIERVGKWIRRKPWSAAAVVACCLGIMGVIVGGAIFNRQLSQAYQKVDEEHGIAVAALDGKSKALAAESKALEAESAARAESDLARTQADEARKRAEESESVSSRRLIDNYVNNGLEALLKNQALQALPWLAEAIAMEQDSDRQSIHQLRFNLAVQSSPKPDRTWLSNSAVIKCRFSDDGKQIYSVTNALKVRIHDIASNKIVRELKSPSQIVDFDITGDHKTGILAYAHVDAASGNLDSAFIEFQVWDTESGKLGDPYKIKISQSKDPDFEPEISAVSKTMAFVNHESSTIDVVDLVTNQVLHSLPVNDSYDVRHQLGKFGRVLAFTDGEDFHVWDIENELPEETFETDEVTNFRILAARHIGIQKEGIQILDLESNSIINQFPAQGDGKGKVAIAPKSGAVAIVWNQGPFELFESNGTRINRIKIDGKVRKVFFSPDEESVFIATRFDVSQFSTDAGIEIGSPIPSTLKPLSDADIDCNNSSLAIAAGSGIFQGSGCLRIWNFSNLENRTEVTRNSEGKVSWMTRSQFGDQLVVRLEPNKNIRVYDVTNRANPRLQFDLLGKTPADRVQWLNISHDGRLVCASLPEQICVIEVASGKEICRCDIANPGNLVLNREGTRLAAVCGEERKNVALINVTTGEVIQDDLKHRRRVTNLRFVGDNDHAVATISNDMNFRLFDSESGKRLEKENLRLIPKSSFIRSDGKVIVAGERLGAQPGRVIMIDGLEGEHIFEPLDFDATVEKVHFGPSGRLAAVADTHGLIRILLTSPLKDTGTQMDHHGPVNDIRFSSDERLLMTVGKDGIVRIYDVVSGLLVRSPFENTDDNSIYRYSRFLNDSYDICLESEQVQIIRQPNQQFSPEHSSALSRFLSGLLISDKGTIRPAAGQSLRKDFSDVTIRQMMDSNLIRSIIHR